MTTPTIEQLHAAAAEHADAGQPVPCQQGTPAERAAWTSEHHDDLARAAEQCAPCPIRAMCRAVAVHHQEATGTWGGTVPGRRGGTGRITARAVTRALSTLGPATAAQVATHIVGEPSPRDRQDTAGALARLAITGRATARRVRGNVNEYRLNTNTEQEPAA